MDGALGIESGDHHPRLTDKGFRNLWVAGPPHRDCAAEQYYQESEEDGAYPPYQPDAYPEPGRRNGWTAESSDQQERPKQEADRSTGAEHTQPRRLKLSEEEHHRERDEADSRPVDRQIAQRYKGERQADNPDHRWNDQPGAENLDDDPYPAYREQQERDIGVGEEPQEPFNGVPFDRPDIDVIGVKDVAGAGTPLQVELENTVDRSWPA